MRSGVGHLWRYNRMKVSRLFSQSMHLLVKTAIKIAN